MTDRPCILVINPNSNDAVTLGMARALEPLNIDGGPEIECCTLSEGPFGIESQADIETVTLPLRKMVSERRDVDAFVIACYSDPGLHVCREATDKPVYGIQECGVLTAMSLGDRFGVIALSDNSIRRHRRYLRQMGVIESLAGERAAGLSVEDSVGGEGTFARLLETAIALRDLDGADTLVLGCAGMAGHRVSLEEEAGLPVIDPVQAATGMAMSAVLLRSTGIT